MKEYDVEAIFNDGFVPPAKYEIKEKIYVFKDKIYNYISDITSSLQSANDEDSMILNNQYDQLMHVLHALKFEIDVVEKVSHKLSYYLLYELREKANLEFQQYEKPASVTYKNKHF